MKYGPTAHATQTCPSNVVVINRLNHFQDSSSKVPFDMKMGCFQLIVKQRDSIFTWNFLASYARKIAFLEIEMTYWETRGHSLKVPQRDPLQPRPFGCNEFSYQRSKKVDFWEFLSDLVWFQKCSIFVFRRIDLKLPKGMILWWWQPFSVTFRTHAHHG